MENHSDNSGLLERVAASGYSLAAFGAGVIMSDIVTTSPSLSLTSLSLGLSCTAVGTGLGAGLAACDEATLNLKLSKYLSAGGIGAAALALGLHVYAQQNQHPDPVSPLNKQSSVTETFADNAANRMAVRQEFCEDNEAFLQEHGFNCPTQDLTR